MAQLAARGSHNPKVAGSIPVESTILPISLGGQDTRLSPERPGFNSRMGNFFYVIPKHKNGHYRAWTGDPWLIRPMLYQLS